MSSITPKPGMTVEITMQGIEKSRLDAIESAEALRVLEEYARELAESGRMLSEENRVNAENQRAADEQSRVDAEKGRSVAEANRVNAEQQRVEAEKLRANAEDARVSAETARANAETLRQSTFETNEAVRQTAFDTAESQRESEWAGIKSDVESSVESAVASASAATDAANTAADNANTVADKSVRYDVAQALSDAQKAQARGNIGAADVSDVDAIKNDLGKKLTSPSSGIEVGKYFRVAAIDDGMAVLEMCDLPICGNDVGLAKVNGWGVRGIAALGNGELYLFKATDAEIKSRSSDYKPIVPKNIDYMVKCVMTDNIGTAWTDAERLNALLRMGCTADENGYVKWTASETTE